jgi:hypothetical protein
MMLGVMSLFIIITMHNHSRYPLIEKLLQLLVT